MNAKVTDKTTGQKSVEMQRIGRGGGDYFLSKPEDQSSNPQHPCKKPATTMHVCDPSGKGTQTGVAASLFPASARDFVLRE